MSNYDCRNIRVNAALTRLAVMEQSSATQCLLVFTVPELGSVTRFLLAISNEQHKGK